MAERRKVLIVDDDKIWQSFLSACLKNDYNVITALDGEIGLKLAQEWTPDTILLGIEMPLKNGFEVCAALKANPILCDIPVIFISSNSSLQEKITGFQLGADDYVVKPCEAEFLVAKVARSTRLYHEKKTLDEKATGAQALAFEAMNSTADMGRSVRFAERTYSIDSLDELADALFKSMAEFGLETSVMFVTPAGPRFYAHNGYDLSLLEKDMFLAIHQEGRFCDFGCRTFCNFTLVSLLIKNMPESDLDRYGRIKDTVPWVLGVLDGKVDALEIQTVLSEQHQYVSTSLHVLNENLLNALESLGKLELHYSSGEALLLHDCLNSNKLLLGELIEEQERVTALYKINIEKNRTSAHGAGDSFSTDVDFF